MIRNYYRITDEIPPIEIIASSSIVVYDISKRELGCKDYRKLDMIFNQLEKCGNSAREKLVLSFDCDDIPDELYEIPKVRIFVESLFNRHTNLFYFLSNELQINRTLILGCLSNVSYQKPIGGTIDGIPILFTYPDGLKSKIDKCTLNYALSVGEKGNDLFEFIDNICPLK